MPSNPVGPLSRRVGVGGRAPTPTGPASFPDDARARLAARGVGQQPSFDSQSGPVDTAGGNGLTGDDMRLIFGFPGLFQAEPETDQFGQPVPGKFRLAPTDQMAILGDNFRLGGRGPTTNNSQLLNTTQNARLLQGLTVKQSLSFLYSLNEDELTKFQVQLFNAGMFNGKDKPTWGVLDEQTRTAFTNLMQDLVNNPDLTVGETLDRATRGFGREMANQLNGEDGAGGRGPKDVLLQPEITDANTLADMVDQVSQDLFGKDLAPDRKASLVANLQQKQRDEFYATTYRQAQIDIKNHRPAGGGSDIDAFMQAISGQESGGDPNAVNPDSGAAGMFQIMPSNWVPWAREAGADPNDRSAANQRKVAAAKMLQYYQQFGNWRDVAIAWYGGPGAVAYGNKDAPQGGYPSINSYADQAMQRFNSIKGAGGTTAYQDPTLAVEFRDKLDVTSEAKSILRAANPAEYEATRFAQRAKDFFSLLAGVQ